MPQLIYGFKGKLSKKIAGNTWAKSGSKMGVPTQKY